MRSVPRRVKLTCTRPDANLPLSLVVQAAGTVLLFVVFLLLYRKFRRPAFLDWIASWGFFLIGLARSGG